MKALASLLLLVAVSSLFAEPVPVTVEPLEKLWLPRQHEAPAWVLSLNTPDISAEISAAVNETRVNAGDVVSKGDVLLDLDCARYRIQQQINQANLERSRAQLAFARGQLVRANNLKKKKSISDELLDQRTTELKVAQADKTLQEQSLALSTINVEDCEVRSPIDGIVSARMVSEGDYAGVGQPLVSLVDLDTLEVEADLDSAEIQSLKQADQIIFEHDNRDFALQLKAVIKQFDYQSATARVRLVFSQGNHPWPGSDGRLKWATRQTLLPAGYLSRRNNGLGVFHAVEGKAVFHLLDNAIEGRPAVVDLPGNTAIVVEGRHRLNHGDVVHVTGMH